MIPRDGQDDAQGAEEIGDKDGPVHGLRLELGISHPARLEGCHGKGCDFNVAKCYEEKSVADVRLGVLVRSDTADKRAWRSFFQERSLTRSVAGAVDDLLKVPKVTLRI